MWLILGSLKIKLCAGNNSLISSVSICCYVYKYTVCTDYFCWLSLHTRQITCCCSTLSFTLGLVPGLGYVTVFAINLFALQPRKLPLRSALISEGNGYKMCKLSFRNPCSSNAYTFGLLVIELMILTTISRRTCDFDDHIPHKFWADGYIY